MNQKPTETKALQGTLQNRPSRAKKPTAEAGEPVAPSWLSRVGRAEWSRILPLLIERGSVTPADATALGSYCMCVSRYVAALNSLEERGTEIETTVLDSNGAAHKKWVINPMLKVAESSERSMFRFLRELGITPAARERVKPAKKTTKGKSLLEQLAERGIN
jgi:P27 family predicted phage terminase small subunit